MSPSVVSEELFPRVYAWVQRFRAALDQARSSAPKAVALEGQEAVNFILSSEFTKPNGTVDANDPLGIEKDTVVEIYPTDWGSEYRDHGRLSALTLGEVTVVARSSAGDTEVRIHAPRTGFRITEIGRDGSAGSNTKL